MCKTSIQQETGKSDKHDIMCNHHRFAMPRINNVLKVTLYYSDVVVPTASVRAFLINKTDGKIYSNLVRNRVAFVPRPFESLDRFTMEFKEIVSTKDFIFRPLFTNFKKDRTIKFPPKNSKEQCLVCDD